MALTLTDFLKFRLLRLKNKHPDFQKYSHFYSKKLCDRSRHISILFILVSLALFFQSIFFMSLGYQIFFALSVFILTNCFLLQKKFPFLIHLASFVSFSNLILISVPFFHSSKGEKPPNSFESNRGYFFLGVFSTIFEMLLIHISNPFISLIQIMGIVTYYSTLWAESQANVYFFISISALSVLVPVRLFQEWKNMGKFLKRESKSMELQIFRFIVEKIETNSSLIITLNKNHRLNSGSINEGPNSKGRKSIINPPMNSSIKIKESVELKVVYRNKEAEIKLGIQENYDAIALLSSLIIVNSRQTNWSCQNISSSSFGEEHPLINIGNRNVDEEQVFDRSVTFKDKVDMLSEFMEIYATQLREIAARQDKQRLPNICMEYVCASSGKSNAEPEKEQDQKGRDKKALRLFIKVLPFFLNDEISFFVFINDISEQVQNAKLKALDKYKDQVLATVTHDLRTPLNVILQSLDVMYQTVEHEENFLKWLHTSRVNGQLLNSLINDILDYAQIKEGKIALNLSYYPISEIMKEIKYIFDIQAVSKGINFKINYETDIPTELFTDKDRLKQIIINLLTNAFKFTRQGGVYLQFSLRKKSQKEELIRVSIRDTGSGIDKKIIPKLFKPYATFKSKNNENKKGIGLGLVICQNLASILGPYSRVYLKSKEGLGSTFWFFIHFKKEDQISINVENKIKSAVDHLLTNSILEDQGTMQKVFGFNKPVASDEEEEEPNRLSDSSDIEESAAPNRLEVSFKSADFKCMPKSNTIGSGSYQTFTTSSIKSKVKRTAPFRQSNVIAKNVEFFPNENMDSIEASFFQRDREKIFKKNTLTKHSSLGGGGFSIIEENINRIRKSTHFDNLKITRTETENFIGYSPKGLDQRPSTKTDLLKIQSLILYNDGEPINEESNEEIQQISGKELTIKRSPRETPSLEDSEVYLLRKLNNKYSQPMLESGSVVIDKKLRGFPREVEAESLKHIVIEAPSNNYRADDDKEKYYLVVDDNQFNHEIYESQLKDLNLKRKIKSRRVFSGKDALEFIENKITYEERLPFLIIMDFEMPEMDGPTATKEIRAILKQNGIDPIPIIGITSHSDKEILLKGKDAGMNNVIARNISKQNFVSAVENFIKN